MTGAVSCVLCGQECLPQPDVEWDPASQSFVQPQLQYSELWQACDDVDPSTGERSAAAVHCSCVAIRLVANRFRGTS